jgi:hypothetical protein
LTRPRRGGERLGELLRFTAEREVIVSAGADLERAAELVSGRTTVGAAGAAAS